MNVIANMILIISPFILPVIALIGIALNKISSNDYFKKIAITVPTKEDYILTLRFFKEQEEKKREQKQINAALELLPYLREDARKAQDEADKMLAKCEKDVQNIAKNLEREKRLTYENSLLM